MQGSPVTHTARTPHAHRTHSARSFSTALPSMPGSSGLGFVSTGSPSNATFRPNRASLSQVKVAPASHDVARTTVEVPGATLFRWNATLSLFHATFAVVTYFVGKTELTVPVFKVVLELDSAPGEAASGGAWQLVPSLEKAGKLPFTALVVAFFVLSSTFHAGNAFVWRGPYEAQLSRCRTPSRWCEYALSAPTMMLLIAYTLGMRDRAGLVAVAVLVGATMPFGYWGEIMAAPASGSAWREPLWWRLLPWVLGHVPQSAAWSLVLLQFYDGISVPSKVPWFVHAILWVEFVLFYSFGAAALLSQLGTPDQFYRGEVLFQVLSFVSKGLLGGLLLANVLMLSRFDEIYDAA